MIGIISVSISLIPGTILGLFAGYFGKRVDSIIMRCMDMLLAFPAILLAIFITAILEPSLTNTMVAVGIVYIPHYARIVRASVLSLKGQLFVQAIGHLGGSHARIIFNHILPNCLPPAARVKTVQLDNTAAGHDHGDGGAGHGIHVYQGQGGCQAFAPGLHCTKPAQFNVTAAAQQEVLVGQNAALRFASAARCIQYGAFTV